MGGQNFVTMGAISDPQNDGILSLGYGAGGLTLGGAAATIVPAVSGKRISVFGMVIGPNVTAQLGVVELTPAGATVTYLNGSSTGNPVSTTAPPGLVLPYQSYPWFTVGLGNALGLFSNNVTVNVGGRVLYTQG